MIIDNDTLDQCLNDVLKVAGFSFKMCTIPKSREDLRAAMGAALATALATMHATPPTWQYHTNPPPLTDVLISVLFEDKQAVEMGYLNQDGLWCLNDGNVLRVATVYAWTPLPTPASTK
jgi:hypothetical protein